MDTPEKETYLILDAGNHNRIILKTDDLESAIDKAKDYAKKGTGQYFVAKIIGVAEKTVGSEFHLL